jgi:hypothetical protein
MKKMSINWDKNLLMEGVSNVTLTKETKDNVVIAIKNRAKEIRDANVLDNNKFTQLLPLLIALPSNKDARTEEFYQKRVQIISILQKMYRPVLNDCASDILDLKAETWEDSDKWFMSMVVKDIAKRKKLDTIDEDDTIEAVAIKYCTAEWLSQTLDFMFEKGYLHQEDVTSNDENDVLALIPNRYGILCPVNELYMQGLIPDELIEDELSKTNYDIKQELLYKDFVLNKKIIIAEKTIASIATKYNDFLMPLFIFS